jgi:predicted ester cyclase
MVAGKVTGYGTHEGELLGIPRTGKKIQMSGIVIWRIKNGKIIEHWGQNDTLGLLQQLGVLPPLGEPRAQSSA